MELGTNKESIVQIVDSLIETCYDYCKMGSDMIPGIAYVLGSNKESKVVLIPVPVDFSGGKLKFFRDLAINTVIMEEIDPYALIVQSEAWSLKLETEQEYKEFRAAGKSVKQTPGSFEIVEIAAMSNDFRYAVTVDISRDSKNNIILGEKRSSNDFDGSMFKEFFRCVSIIKEALDHKNESKKS